MIYNFTIAGLRFRATLPFELTITPESRPFLIEYEDFDFEFCFTPVNTIPLPADGHWFEGRFFSGDATYVSLFQGGNPYARVFWRKDTPTLECQYVRGMESELCYSRNLIDLLSLETLCLKFNGLLLHASLICTRDSAILFSAPCGTGKSTQASLWEKYENAEVLNGDRAILRNVSGKWMAFGSPYAGSSGIFRNESAPVMAIVLLRQAKENKIRRLSPAKAIRYIYPEFSIHRWDSNFLNSALNLIFQLLSAVPVYMLECLPDQGAVQMLKDTLFKEREYDSDSC